MKLKKKIKPYENVIKSENKVSQERKRLDSNKIRINGDSALKNRKKKEKKGRLRKEVWKKIKKHVNFYTKRGEINNAYFYDMHMILLVYKKTYFNINDFDYYIHIFCVSLLHDFKDIFPGKIPNGLPPTKGIMHQINVVPGAYIPNQPTYIINPDGINKL